MRLLISGIVLLLIVISCYYDSVEYLYPQINNTCDTTNITFSGSVKPILDNFCLSCHNNSNADASGFGIKLENIADVEIKANDGTLMKSILHTGNFPMPLPLGSPKLDDCKIATFRIWIAKNFPQ